MTKLWILRTEGATRDLDCYLSVLTEAEKEKARRYRFEEDRIRAVLGAYLIHKAFCEDFPQETYALAYNAYGKPFYPNRLLAQKQAYFNISHSGGLVVLAKAPFDLGVDVEKIRALDFSKFKTVFSQAELASVQNAPSPSEAFFTLWTRKEAFVKCVGKGVSALGEYAVKGNAYAYVTKKIEGHMLTVCAKQDHGVLDKIEIIAPEP